MISTKLTLACLGGIALLLSGGLSYKYLATASSPVKTPSDLEKYAGAGPLDGKAFVGQLGPIGKSPDVEDVWVFSKGMFVSKECERRCSYPPRPYFVRSAKGKTEFISETRCPYKDAKLVWRGTVDGQTVKGVVTWTVSRWYWTIKKKFAFEGRLHEQTSPVTSN